MSMVQGDSHRVSVIIPTWNRSRWVVEAVASVLAQSRAADEILVVDDGSDDDTAAALGRFLPHIGYVYLRRGGVSRARNIGFRCTSGDLVAFLDSDDLWHPQKLQRQLDTMSAHPECRLCYTDEIWIRHGVRVNPGHKHRKYSGWIFERCLPLCLISPSSALMRRSLLDELNGFDESLPVCEDYDLWLRITSRYPVTFLPEALITKRGGHGDQLSASRWGMDRYRVRALVKILRGGGLAPPLRDAAWAELQRKCAILEAGCRKHGRAEESDYYRALPGELASVAG